MKNKTSKRVDFTIREIKLSYTPNAFDSALNKVIRNPQEATEALTAVCEMVKVEPTEMCVALFLDSQLSVIGYTIVSQGMIDCSFVDPRRIFQAAILSNARSIILVHNHPSFADTPSQEDVKLTNRIEQGAELFGIKLLDHVIVAGNKVVSIKHNRAAEDMC